MLSKKGYQGLEERSPRHKCIDLKPLLIFVDSLLCTSSQYTLLRQFSISLVSLVNISLLSDTKVQAQGWHPPYPRINPGQLFTIRFYNPVAILTMALITSNVEFNLPDDETSKTFQRRQETSGRQIDLTEVAMGPEMRLFCYPDTLSALMRTKIQERTRSTSR